MHGRGPGAALVYDASSGTGDAFASPPRESEASRAAEPIEVALPPALAAFVLVLVAAREIDERAAHAPHGPHDPGAAPGLRSLEAIGRAMASVPGPENAVEADTVGGYKRALMRRVRAAVRARGLAVGSSDPDAVPPPVVNPGYGLGYALHEAGAHVHGIDVDALVAAVEAGSPRPTSPCAAPRTAAGVDEVGSARVFAPPSIRC